MSKNRSNDKERLYKDISSSGEKQKILKKQKKKDIFKSKQNEELFKKNTSMAKDFKFDTPNIYADDIDEEEVYMFVEFKDDNFDKFEE